MTSGQLSSVRVHCTATPRDHQIPCQSVPIALPSRFTGTLAVGERVEALWDVQPSAEMSRHQKAIHEEGVAESLVEDLTPR